MSRLSRVAGSQAKLRGGVVETVKVSLWPRSSLARTRSILHVPFVSQPLSQPTNVRVQHRVRFVSLFSACTTLPRCELKARPHFYPLSARVLYRSMTLPLLLHLFSFHQIVQESLALFLGITSTCLDAPAL